MAQAFGTDIQLDGGAAIINLRTPNHTTAPAAPNKGQVYFNTTDNKFYGYNGTTWIDISQIVNNAIVLKGDLTNANTNPAFPASPATGDSYFVTTNAGTIGGLTVEIGDQLIFGNSGWFVLQANIITASVTAAGVSRLATQAEMNAGLAGVAATPDKIVTYVGSLAFAKKAVVVVGTLAANTPAIVTHNFGLASFSDMSVDVYSNATKINIDLAFTSANTVTITSLASYSMVRVVFFG